MTFDQLYTLYGDQFPDVGELRFRAGWCDLLARHVEALRRIAREHGYPPGTVKVVSASQKFGELRVVHSEVEDGSEVFRQDIFDTVQCTTLRSRFTCEECGKPGRLRRFNNGGVFAACDEHAHGTEPLPGHRGIKWEGPGGRWRTYTYDERDRQITITWSTEGDEQ